jgi:NADH:ubiquinone oxidoreductase subunit 5 (subunit L)/multisubunit Na+/H+ antiporter MnhA subunit
VVGKDIAVIHGALPHEAHHLDPIEYVTMAISLTVAISGILLARAMYQTKRASPDRVAELGGGVIYRTVLNKYYVDELYQMVFVGGLLALSRAAAWFDQNVIDFIVSYRHGHDVGVVAGRPIRRLHRRRGGERHRQRLGVLR